MRRSQNFAGTQKGRNRGKIFPSMAANSYLNDNVEGKQFYFSFGCFSTQRSSNLDLNSPFDF